MVFWMVKNTTSLSQNCLKKDVFLGRNHRKTPWLIFGMDRWIMVFQHRSGQSSVINFPVVFCERWPSEVWILLRGDLSMECKSQVAEFSWTGHSGYLWRKKIYASKKAFPKHPTRRKPRNGTGHISKSILCGRCGMVLEGRNATGARGRARRHTPNMFRVRRLNATFVSYCGWLRNPAPPWTLDGRNPINNGINVW